MRADFHFISLHLLTHFDFSIGTAFGVFIACGSSLTNSNIIETINVIFNGLFGRSKKFLWVAKKIVFKQICTYSFRVILHTYIDDRIDNSTDRKKKTNAKNDQHHLPLDRLQTNYDPSKLYSNESLYRKKRDILHFSLHHEHIFSKNLRT